jgi:teichuronic acid biosynthesis glycosyltransferase TuaC
MVFARREAAILHSAGVEVRPFFLGSRTSPLDLVKEFLRFRREIELFRPHLIHAHYGTVTALFCALATARPLVVTFRGTDLNPCPTMNPLRSFVGRLFSQLAALRASGIVCATRRLKDRLWWGTDRATILAGYVDLTLFQPQERSEARQALGWSLTDKFVLFNAGHTPKVKRLDLAQAAVCEANKINGNPEVKMVVLDGQIDPNLIPIYLNAADCLLVTSDWEGSPYIVKEALSCNLPIVSVDVGDVAERVQGVTPSRIVARNAASLGRAVLEVLALGRRSNGRLATADLSEEKVAEGTRFIYDRVLNKDKGRTAAKRETNHE